MAQQALVLLVHIRPIHPLLLEPSATYVVMGYVFAPVCLMHLYDPCHCQGGMKLCDEGVVWEPAASLCTDSRLKDIQVRKNAFSFSSQVIELRRPPLHFSFLVLLC